MSAAELRDVERRQVPGGVGLCFRLQRRRGRGSPLCGELLLAEALLLNECLQLTVDRGQIGLLVRERLLVLGLLGARLVA